MRAGRLESRKALPEMKAKELEAQLVRLHPESFGWALHCCQRNRTEAEDVLQTSYLKVLSGKARYGGKAPFKTWLFGVIRITALEQRREGAIREEKVLPLVPRETPNRERRDLLAGLEEKERVGRLLESLKALSERQRQVLHLVFYQELTISEAAEVMGVSLGTARTHYERGKERLRTLLTMDRNDDRTSQGL